MYIPQDEATAFIESREEGFWEGVNEKGCALFPGLRWIYTANVTPARVRAGNGCDIPNFKGSYLGRVPLVSADFWTSDRLSEESRSVDVVFATHTHRTLKLKRR